MSPKATAFCADSVANLINIVANALTMPSIPTHDEAKAFDQWHALLEKNQALELEHLKDRRNYGLPSPSV